MIDGYVVGDKEVVQRFQGMSARLRLELRASIGKLTFQLVRIVQNEKLRGQVLKYRSGRLFRSVGNPVIEDRGDTVTGIASTPLRYGKAHEEGFHGTVNVREHLRQIKEAFGRPIVPTTVTVSAHTMKMNLPERSFLRSALRDLESSGVITIELQAAKERATS